MHLGKPHWGKSLLKVVNLKFLYSEKATKFCEIFTLLLSVCTVVKSKVEISQNFMAFSEYTNFNSKFEFDLIIKHATPLLPARHSV